MIFSPWNGLGVKKKHEGVGEALKIISGRVI